MNPEHKDDEEESDDYDEFYNDRGFLNTGMASKQYDKPMFGIP